MMLHRLLWIGVIVVLGPLFLCPDGSAKIPEPDNIIYGTVGDTVNTVTMKIDNETITSYTMGSNSSADHFYILRVPIDVLSPPRPGTAKPGDVAGIYVNSDANPATTVVIGERGSIKQINLMGDSDIDEDGIPDDWELTHFGNLSRDGTEDYDGDGLSDVEEYQNDTDPKDKDSDHDGMPDGWEVDYELNPLVNDASDDADDDGYTNLQEYVYNTKPNDSTSKPGAILMVHSAFVTPGLKMKLPVAYANSDKNITEAEFELAFDASLISIDNITQGSALNESGFILSVNRLSPEPKWKVTLTPPDQTTPLPDGEIVVLGIKVAATAPIGQQTEIVPENLWMSDQADNVVPIQAANGIISIRKYLPGDATADGQINVLDVMAIINEILYATPVLGDSDCTGDGSVNVLDVMCTLHWILYVQ